MAFAGAISDLFSCGRPRRPQTRDETNTGEDASRVAATLDPASPGDIRATANTSSDKPPVDASALRDATRHAVPEHDVSHIRPAERERLTNSISSTIRASTEAVRDLEHVPQKKLPQDRDEPNEGSRDEKVEAGKGWQVEQRFLVTTNTPGTSDANLEEEPDDAEAPVSEVTPMVEAQNATLPIPTETNKLELENAKEAVIAHAVIDTKLRDDDQAASATPPAPELQGGSSSVVALEVEGVEVETHEKTAPKQLLDLPTEIRNLIYERIIEASPIRMCRYDDPALVRSENELTGSRKRQFYNLTQVCRQIRKEFLPMYAERTEYIIDLWAQKANLTDLDTLKGRIAMDIDAACFDMEPIDLLPLIRYLARTRRTNCRFASTEGVVFRSIESIVQQLNKLLPSTVNKSWLAAVNGPMKRIDLHLFPHEDIRQYYRFRGAEPMLRIVYPSSAIEDWMKQSHKSGGEYELYLEKTGLNVLEMHIVVGHASRRTTNEGRLPLDWRLSYVGSRLSIDQAARISGTWTR